MNKPLQYTIAAAVLAAASTGTYFASRPSEADKLVEANKVQDLQRYEFAGEFCGDKVRSDVKRPWIGKPSVDFTLTRENGAVYHFVDKGADKTVEEFTMSGLDDKLVNSDGMPQGTLRIGVKDVNAFYRTQLARVYGENVKREQELKAKTLADIKAYTHQ